MAHPEDKAEMDRLLAEAKPDCQHDYQLEPYTIGGCIVIYACTKCGDEYEKDVS